MVEFAGDDTMEDALDTTTVQAGAAADETDGGRTDCANDDEGGVRRGGEVQTSTSPAAKEWDGR